MPLTSAERKHLRGQAQTLKPALHLGKSGLTPAVLTEIEGALERHHLVKLRFETPAGDPTPLIRQIETVTGAECIGQIGHTASFFRPPSES